MRSTDRFRHFIFVSLALHVLFFAGLFVAQKIIPQAAVETLEISLLTDEELQALHNTQQPESLKQIVETNPDEANNTLAENAQYLSAKDNRVEKETRAQYGEQFKNSQRQKSASASSESAPTKKTTQQNKNSQKKTTPQLFDDGFNAYQALSEQQNFQLQQQARQLAAAGGDASSTNDNLPDAEESLQTRLNTREYKYYSYYSRIKNQLNQWWVPAVQQKFAVLMKQGRTVASEESKVTKLIIVLNDRGLLVNVKVLAESGVRELDEAAIEAFRSAAPFPNPPRGMIEPDGTVQIRWDCVVES